MALVFECNSKDIPGFVEQILLCTEIANILVLFPKSHVTKS